MKCGHFELIRCNKTEWKCKECDARLELVVRVLPVNFWRTIYGPKKENK